MSTTNVNPPSPSNPGYGKLGAAVIGGAVATLVIGIINHASPGLLDPSMDAALQTLFTAGAVWIVPHSLSN
jgi:hypothetical protein